MSGNKEFETIYERNNKLKHIEIGEVYYFNEDEQQFNNATLEVFGYASILRVIRNGEIYQSIRSISSEDSEMDYSIVDFENGITVALGNNILKLSKGQLDLIDKHYNALNHKFILERKQFQEEIDQLVEDLSKNREIDELLEAYISEVPDVYFLHGDFMLEVECKLEERDRKGKYILFSSDLFRKLNQADEETVNVNDYLENYFDMLVGVISRKYQFIDKTYAMFTVYKLLMTKAVSYFGDEWKKEYSEYFIDEENLALEELTTIYINIDTIEPMATRNVGKFLCYLMDINKDPLDNTNFFISHEYFFEILDEIMKQKTFLDFEKKLKMKKRKINYTIDDIDLMNGTEFEKFVSLLFTKMGYNCTLTKSSGDQGIDVICEKNGRKIGVQAKCYSNKVSNSAIQETVAGMKYYNCDKGMVITNNFFTDSAIDLANVNDVVLWDREMLKNKINDLLV